MALAVVRESRDEDAPPAIDWAGCLLAIAGFSLLVAGLDLTATLGWDSLAVWIVLASSIAALVVFIVVEVRTKHPLIDFNLFAGRDFVGSAAVGFAINFTLGALMLFLTLYLQHVGALSPLDTGLAFLAFSLVLAETSVATGFISGAWGTGRTIALGMALNGLSFLILIFSGTTVSLAMVLLALVLGGAGQSLAYNPSTAVAMAAVPSAKAGAASGTIGSIRILAVAVGVAVTTAIFKAFENSELAALISTTGKSLTSADIREVHGLVSGSQSSASALAKLAPSAADSIVAIVDHAFVAGFSVVMTLCAVLSALGIAAAFLVRPPATDDGPS
jgi:hypothetical protein